MPAPTRLRCEELDTPLALATAGPRFSWEPSAPYAAWRITAASTQQLLEAGEPDLWDSGRTEGDDCFGIEWAGAPLAPHQRCWWRVTVYGPGSTTATSQTAVFETGMLGAQLRADWLAPAPGLASAFGDSESLLAGCAWAWRGDRDETAELSASFDLDDPRASEAWLLVTVAGPWELSCNGQVIDTGTYWRTACFANLLPWLKPGANTLELRVPRTVTGPAGVCSRLLIRDAGGSRSEDMAAHWQDADILGTYGDLPWGNFRSVTPPGQPPRFTVEFRVDDVPTGARLHISALGLYRANLNGRMIGTQRLSPGWTDYRQRALYQTHDVDDLLQAGNNTLEVQLADGWYAGNVSCVGRSVYGSAPAFICELHTGAGPLVLSDADWRVSAGTLRSADLIKGEWTDFREQHTEQLKPEVLGEGPELQAATTQPVRVLRRWPARAIRKDGSAWLVDFGQNFSGHVRLRLPAGLDGPVSVRHAERLTDDGGLYTENLRGATQLDVLHTGGKAVTHEPGFTVHGFRHARVSGLTAEPLRHEFEACEVSSDLDQAGTFSSSSTLLNRLQEAILWTQRSNYGAIPTDCPNRDERMGWLDVHAMAETAMFNYDLSSYYPAWLRSMREAQYGNGVLPHVVPDVLEGGGGEAGWADCAVLLPWHVFRRYGDARVLADNFKMMLDWIRFMERESPSGIRPDAGFGDWLAAGEETPRDLIGTAYFARSSAVAARTARLLAMHEEANRLESLSRRVAQAFRDEYMNADGTTKPDTQTSYVLALTLGVLEPGSRQRAADRLATLIERRGSHATGYMGAPWLLNVLSDHGHHDVATGIALSTDYPGWGYMLDNGATTLWERWDSYRPGQEPGDPAMNSYNHPSLCAIGDWLYSRVGGLRGDAPGFSSFRVEPHVGSGIEQASVTYRARRGTIRVDWRLEGDRLNLQLRVPPGCTATVRDPFSPASAVLDGGEHLLSFRKGT